MVTAPVISTRKKAKHTVATTSLLSGPSIAADTVINVIVDYIGAVLRRCNPRYYRCRRRAVIDDLSGPFDTESRGWVWTMSRATDADDVLGDDSTIVLGYNR